MSHFPRTHDDVLQWESGYRREERGGSCHTDVYQLTMWLYDAYSVAEDSEKSSEKRRGRPDVKSKPM